jgi:hypothetical protein
MRVLREFAGLLAEFVSGQMICFEVGGGSGSMGMGCQVVKFRGSVVRTLGHGILLGCSMQGSRAKSGENLAPSRTKADGLHPLRVSAKRMEPTERMPLQIPLTC